MDLDTDVRRERADRAYTDRLYRDGEPDMRECSVCGGEFVYDPDDGTGENECAECREVTP